MNNTISHYEHREGKFERTTRGGARHTPSDEIWRYELREGKRTDQASFGHDQQGSRENSATIRTATDENEVQRLEPGNMNTCYIYLRVSTDEQATEGFSLENQKRACMDYARSHDYHTRRIFLDDGKSGRTTQRPAFQELIAEIEKYKVDALIIYKIDRFARNVSDFRDTRKEIEAKGVEMISVLEGNVTKGSSLIANILASVAEWESDVNGQRTRDALMQKFREGWQPTPPPVGYRSVGGDRERKTCEPDPHTAPIIKELFELYATGSYSIIEIQDWLADRNIISRNGTGLGHSVIHTILNNPFYFGIIRWHGESKTGNHIPIISKDLYDVCQYVLAKHRNFLMRRRIHNWLLGGFAYCAECGQRYVAEWHNNAHKLRARGGKIAYYHCPKRERNGCHAPYVEMLDIETQVEEEFKNMQFAPEFIEAVVRKTREKLDESRVNALSIKQGILNRKLALEGKRNKLEDALIEGTIDREVFKRKHTEIQKQLEHMDIQMQEVENRCRIDMNLIDETLAFTRNIYTTYKDAPPFMKRHYLRFFYEKITIKNKVIFETIPTPIFATLRDNRQVIQKTLVLPR